MPVTTDRHPDDDRIARIRLDRPDRNNVVDLELLYALSDAIAAADRDEEVQGIMLGATGEPFCAGGALEELRDLPWAEGARWMTAFLETMDLLRDTGKPAVAAVEGAPAWPAATNSPPPVTWIVAGESARFGQPEAGVGSTAAGGGVQLLPLVVGEKRARDLLLTGRLLANAEARAFGLINRVVEDGAADEGAAALLGEIVDEKSPQAYRTIKAMLKPWTNFGMLGWKMARDLTARTWDSEAFQERADAFLAREEQKPREFHGTRPRERDTGDELADEDGNGAGE
jgi:enoyl-CoA hydratase/carnithine racemase